MDCYQISNLIRLQKASCENRLVVFVGAGVSINSGIPSWNEFIEILKQELPSRLSCETDALKIAQLYKDSRGHKEYMDKVKEILLYNKAVPNQLHRSILSLNPCHIITTNYDDLIEQELQNEFMQYDVVREDKDITHIVCPNTLVKMHGDFSKDNIVLTEKDYYDYGTNFPLIKAYVQSLFASKLVLFVGFSFADMNLRMILNELQNILSENMQRAYLLSCQEPDYITRQYYEKKGINILYLSEKEVDIINGSSYPNNVSLTGRGLHTDKILYAIKNYSAISKEDLALYLYERIQPYFNEIKSFGDGLKYFFPKGKDMVWNPHSEGLQTGLSYFENLSTKLKTNQAKRQFLLEHPTINLRKLLKIAFYNYLYEIDGLKIIDENILQNKERYFGMSTLFYIHRFDSEKVFQILKNLRSMSIKYSIEDLEQPYTLYALGNYWEAYQQYVKLLPLYWNKGKYILYFICRYNLWSIRYSAALQLMSNKGHDIKKEIELATEKEPEDILNKLPLDHEIKKIFQDLISYRSIGNHVIISQELNEKISQQRKSAERRGFSINSNIDRLLSIYKRESLFSCANFIICDNNKYYKSVCENCALGILNSFATLSSTMFGGLVSATKIDALDDFMVELLVFCIKNKRLKEIINGYEISTLKFDKDGIDYINSCLDGLVQRNQSMFKDEARLSDPLGNLLLLISKSEDDGINVGNLYKLLIKDLPICKREQIKDSVYVPIIRKYEPTPESAMAFIWELLRETTERYEYAQSIFVMTRILKDKGVDDDVFEFDKLTNKKKVAWEISFLYPILTNTAKDQVLKFLLKSLDRLYEYIHFVYYNKIDSFSVERFKELLDKGKKGIAERECFILAKMRQCEHFHGIHIYIDELAKTNDCMSFFLSPFDFQNYDVVKIEWILKYDDEGKRKLFQVVAYRELLKKYISENSLNDKDKRYLINFL